MNSALETVAGLHCKMREPLPDRVSVDPASPFYREDYRRLGVKIDGKDIGDCSEYCVSESWCKRQLKMANGKLERERGRPITVTHHGKIEPYWRLK